MKTITTFLINTIYNKYVDKKVTNSIANINDNNKKIIESDVTITDLVDNMMSVIGSNNLLAFNLLAYWANIKKKRIVIFSDYSNLFMQQGLSSNFINSYDPFEDRSDSEIVEVFSEIYPDLDYYKMENLLGVLRFYLEITHKHMVYSMMKDAPLDRMNEFFGDIYDKGLISDSELKDALRRLQISNDVFSNFTKCMTLLKKLEKQGLMQNNYNIKGMNLKNSTRDLYVVDSYGMSHEMERLFISEGLNEDWFFVNFGHSFEDDNYTKIKDRILFEYYDDISTLSEMSRKYIFNRPTVVVTAGNIGTAKEFSEYVSDYIKIIASKNYGGGGFYTFGNFNGVNNHFGYSTSETVSRRIEVQEVLTLLENQCYLLRNGQIHKVNIC